MNAREDTTEDTIAKEGMTKEKYNSELRFCGMLTGASCILAADPLNIVNMSLYFVYGFAALFALKCIFHTVMLATMILEEKMEEQTDRLIQSIKQDKE